MDRTETLEEFYKRKFSWVPEGIRNELGHFNVFRLDPFVGSCAKPVPYKKRDFFKITIFSGNATVHFADRSMEVRRHALAFSNPMIPYRWEGTEKIESGWFCIFNKDFFKGFGDLGRYTVFQPGGNHVLELDKGKLRMAAAVFQRMASELASDYVHKYDVLRNLVFELLHIASRADGSAHVENVVPNAAQRISALFLELLERQFPVDDNHPAINLRFPSEFARQLNVHTNHLNRALREAAGKSTSELIASRLIQEARVLLSQSHWNVTEIGYALGFREVSHFNNFFRKHTGMSPVKYRRQFTSED